MMKPYILFIAVCITGMICKPVQAQPKQQMVTLQALNCDGYDCYFKFFNPKTKKTIPVKGINFDDKYEKNWKAAWKEVLERDGEQDGLDWLIGKKYVITLVYRIGESSHLDENADIVIEKTKRKEWFVTSLRRLP